MIENLENEQWKTISGYENYQVSNYGRVKSLKGKEERILKQGTTKNGYRIVGLYKDGKSKWFSVHRLVAMAFIDNSNNYPVVNHIDECRTNNHVENLEWCTVEYNSNYGTARERQSKAISGENHPMYGKFGKDNPTSKQVIQLTLGGDYIKLWGGIREIERTLGYHSQSISKCCRGKQKTSNGYKWVYA